MAGGTRGAPHGVALEAGGLRTAARGGWRLLSDRAVVDGAVRVADWGRILLRLSNISIWSNSMYYSVMLN